MENDKLQFSKPIWLVNIISFRVSSYIITSYLAGDYFQVLRNMDWQQSSLIITLEWEYSY